MTVTEFLENHASYILLFIIIIGYLFLKKVLTEKRFKNRQFVFDDPYEVAQLTVKEYQKKNPEMLVSLGNLTKIKELTDFIVAKILSVNDASNRTLMTLEVRKR